MGSVFSVLSTAALVTTLAFPVTADCPPSGGALAPMPGDQTHLSARRRDLVRPLDGWTNTFMHVVWSDDRALGSTGRDLWRSGFVECAQDDPDGGVPVCTDPSSQDFPSLDLSSSPPPPGETCGQWGCTADALITAWEDTRNGNLDIFARRQGNYVFGAWDSVAIAICTAAGDQSAPSTAGDPAHGGAAFAWIDRRAGDADIYVQTVDSTGTAQWGMDGIAACAAAGDQTDVSIFRESDLSVILCWLDRRAGSAVSAIRLGTDGAPLGGWSADGNLLSGGPAVATSLRAAPDGSNGLYVAWTDERAGDEGDVYVQHVQGDGAIAPGWPADGLPVASAAAAERLADVAADAGGVYLVWEDDRNVTSMQSPPNVDLYAQRVLADGTTAPGWPAGGLAVCTEGSRQQNARLAQTRGGVLIAWSDQRSGPDTPDIYALKVEVGATLPPGWSVDGLLICGASDAQVEPVVVGQAELGGGRIAWVDYRERATRGADVYGANVGFEGGVDVPRPLSGGAALSLPWPNPSSRIVSFSLTLQAPGTVTMRVHDVAGRAVRTVRHDFVAAGAMVLRWDGRDEKTRPAAPGVYLVEISAPSFRAARRVVLLDP